MQEQIDLDMKALKTSDKLVDQKEQEINNINNNWQEQFKELGVAMEKAVSKGGNVYESIYEKAQKEFQKDQKRQTTGPDLTDPEVVAKLRLRMEHINSTGDNANQKDLHLHGINPTGNNIDTHLYQQTGTGTQLTYS